MLFFIPIIWLAIIVLMLFAQWKLFEKAGKPGWTSLIPFYNSWVFSEMVFGYGWFIYVFCLLIVLLTPIKDVGIVIAYALSFILTTWQCIRLCKSFNKGTGFIIGMIFFPAIFVLILGLDSSVWTQLPPVFQKTEE